MVDEMFDHTYQSGRADLNNAIRAIFWSIGHLIGDSLQVLHQMEWSAPWAALKKKPPHGV